MDGRIVVEKDKNKNVLKDQYCKGKGGRRIDW